MLTAPAMAWDPGRGDDRIARQPRHDGAPRLPRRHVFRLALAALGVPDRARVILLVVHGLEGIRPAALAGIDFAPPLHAACIPRIGGEAREDLLGDELRVSADGHCHGLGEPDAIGVDVHLDDGRGLRPVIEAVAREG